MPEQVQVSSTQWTVGEAQVETADGVMEARVCVFTDVMTDKTYVFPIPADEAKEMAKVLAAENCEEAMIAYVQRKEARAKIAVPNRPPTQDELRHAQARGQA